MPELVFLLLLFLAARVPGRLLQRGHQPASVGEALAGALIALALGAALGVRGL